MKRKAPSRKTKSKPLSQGQQEKQGKLEAFLKTLKDPQTPQELLKSLEGGIPLPLNAEDPDYSWTWIRQLYGTMHRLEIPWTPALHIKGSLTRKSRMS
jgi:hypothetical protein